MWKFLEFLFYTIPLILSWLYLIAAIYSVVVHIRNMKKHVEISIGQWLFALLNCVYILFFVITLIFSFAVWETVFGTLGLLAMVICFCLSRYDDMRHGRRWWGW